MPRIAAATVREHRENVRTALVDAAESIVRTEGVSALTAGAVTKAAGIARNSIYRYVDSVDDLRGLVLERHLPGWMGAVGEAVAAAGDDPAARILAWSEANLQQAARTGHGWLIDLATGITLGTDTRDAVDHAHRDAEDTLLVEWTRLVEAAGPAPRAESRSTREDEQRAIIGAELTRSIVNGGFRLLDRGEGLSAVSPAVLDAVRSLVESSQR